VKSAASIAICITCSWKIGTPFVRISAGFSSSGQAISSSRRVRFFRYGWTMPPWIGPGRTIATSTTRS
jgi:hypothetical protein